MNGRNLQFWYLHHYESHLIQNLIYIVTEIIRFPRHITNNQLQPKKHIIRQQVICMGDRNNELAKVLCCYKYDDQLKFVWLFFPNLLVPVHTKLVTRNTLFGFTIEMFFLRRSCFTWVICTESSLHNTVLTTLSEKYTLWFYDRDVFTYELVSLLHKTA